MILLVASAGHIREFTRVASAEKRWCEGEQGRRRSWMMFGVTEVHFRTVCGEPFKDFEHGVDCVDALFVGGAMEGKS